MIGIYAQKNKTLESEVKTLSVELTKAKEMLKNVEKYWSHQVFIYILIQKLIFYLNLSISEFSVIYSQKAIFLWPSHFF